MLKSVASRFTAVIFITVGVLSVWADPGFAQRSFGISYAPPESTDRFLNDLRYLQQTGIHSLLIDDMLMAERMTSIVESGFDVYVNIPVFFPTVWSLEENRNELLDQWVSYINFYRRYDNVKGIGLFSFGQTHSPYFRDFFRLLKRELDQITDIPLFYVSSDDDNEFAEMFDYRIFRATDTSSIAALSSFDDVGGIIYAARDKQFDVRVFQTMLGQTRDMAEVPIFFEWDWFVHNRNANEFMEEVIRSYAHDPNALFANPRIRQVESSSNWLILVLLLIWGSFVVHYSLVPTYRKSLLRFFDNHKFFISDVIERQLRVGLSNLIILVQQGFLGGLFAVALSKYTLSPLGYEALAHHLPFLEPGTPGYFMIFLGGFLFFILVNLICTGWLYLTNTGIRHLNQAAIFQLWPQHLNLFVITFLIALILAGSNIALINTVTIMSLFIFFGSFLFAVIDAGKQAYTRFYYYPLTIVIYGALLVGFTAWVYLDTGFIELWDLAVSLQET
ncbi:MAG: hypothetical protein WD266_06605 [Balneolales bacterium]